MRISIECPSAAACPQLQVAWWRSFICFIHW